MTEKTAPTEARMMEKVLIGNAFPMALFVREASVRPETADTLRATLAGGTVFSFWGHASSLSTASRFVGADLAPRQPRPALALSDSGYPTLHGVVFRDCWILTPSAFPASRPAPGELSMIDQSTAWRVLRIHWS